MLDCNISGEELAELREAGRRVDDTRKADRTIAVIAFGTAWKPVAVA